MLSEPNSYETLCNVSTGTSQGLRAAKLELSLLRHTDLVQAFRAVVADLLLWGFDADPLIYALKKANIPFLTYSGYFNSPTGRFAHVQKPKGADAVLVELERRFEGR